MMHSDFKMGMFFKTDTGTWKVTDLGSRTVIAIPLKFGWMDGPPYALEETVFDEIDFEDCTLVTIVP